MTTGHVELGHGTSDSAGAFRITLSMLPAQIAVEVRTSSAITGGGTFDSATVRRSATMPVIIRLVSPHTLAPVRVQARYQKRPSIYSFLEREPSVLSKTISPTVTEWFDPLSAGDAAALLRASPNMLIGADGSASMMGMPSSANQLQINGVQVPASLLIGLNAASVTSSPWDITVGGAAGATVNVEVGAPQRYHHAQATIRSGVAGVPGWTGARGQSYGVNVPLQLSAGITGPMGRLGYRANAFLLRDNVSVPRWDAAVTAGARRVLDSLSEVLGEPTVITNGRSVQAGVTGRLDFVPFDSRKVLALTGGYTRSEQSGVPGGQFMTGSLGVDAIQNVGLLQLLSKRVLGERVLLSSQASASISTTDATRAVVAPTIIATDVTSGNTIMTGGSGSQPTSRVLAAELRSTAGWYSRDNRTYFVAQLQGRAERARLGGTGPHATFTTASMDALGEGEAIALVRNSGASAAAAESFVLAPAVGVRRDLGNGSLMLGVRADAWRTNGVSEAGTMQYVDLSPRASLYQRLGHRSANQGSVAILRAGIGRFTSWPGVQQWADAWTSSGRTRELCGGIGVPSISLDVEAASCTADATVQQLGRTVAYNDLRPAASNRADVSITFPEIAPGVTGELGAAFSRNNRIAARVSPLVAAPVLADLTGEDGRALLVSESSITDNGIVPVAQIPSGAPDVTRLVSAAHSEATQWRVALSNTDPFQRFDWRLAYTHTSGRERSLAIASPNSAPSFVSGPLSAGGEHAVGFSIGTWLGGTSIHIGGLARSGVRFTPLADRDLNGDGRANDAAFVPTSLAAVWAERVTPAVRSCVLRATGQIASMNSCTGPWNITSIIDATIPGPALGLSQGYSVSLELSNPLSVFGGSDRVSFGEVSGVNPVLEHVTGFDASDHNFTGEPLAGFGMHNGFASGVASPVRFAVAVSVPVGPTVISQRAGATIAVFEQDTSAHADDNAATQLLGDIPPVPIIILQGARTLHLTSDQQKKLQALGARWNATRLRLVHDAYRGGAMSGRGSHSSLRARLLAARARFWIAGGAINQEIRGLLNPDQMELLGSGITRLLDPRFWRYASMQDAGDI
jgi:hypothetical protein